MNKRGAINFFVIIIVAVAFASVVFYGVDEITSYAVYESCVDSDSGLNYDIKGEVILEKENRNPIIREDKCKTKTILKEWSCEGNRAKRTNIFCDEGCRNGKCVSISPEVPVVPIQLPVENLPVDESLPISNNPYGENVEIIPSIKDLKGIDILSGLRFLSDRNFSYVNFALDGKNIRVFLTDPRGTFEVKRVRIEAKKSSSESYSIERNRYIVSFIDPRTNEGYLVVLRKIKTAQVGSNPTLEIFRVISLYSEANLQNLILGKAYNILPGSLEFPLGPEVIEITEPECSVGNRVMISNGEGWYCNGYNWLKQRVSGAYCWKSYMCLSDSCVNSDCV